VSNSVRGKLQSSERSVHLYGQGTCDGQRGIEKARIKVTLATGIAEERCRVLHLGYTDYRRVDMEDWKDRESEGMKLIRHAGDRIAQVQSESSASAN
jgi:hypothetical protein